MLRTLASAALLLLSAAISRADVIAEVSNGDKITGTLSPADEAEVFRVRVPKGAAISVKAKAATKGLVLDVVLADPADAPVANASASAPSLKGIVAGSSGLFTVRVTSHGGTVTGNYSLSITWKSPKSFAASVSVDPAGAKELPFAADAGAVASLAVKPGKGSPATAALSQLILPDASVASLNGSTNSRTLAAGDHVLVFTNSGAAAGLVSATVKLKIPKAAKRKIVLTSSVIGAGGGHGDAAFAAVVGSGGGTVSFPNLPPGSAGAALSGSAVEIPAGALGIGTSIVIATAPDLDVPAPAVGGGPPVHFGPDGLAFATEATITIPYNAGYSAADAATLVVYTRDAKGKVTAVPGPYAIDSAAHTISFSSSHFSAYQVAGDQIVPEIEMFTTGLVTTPEDVSLAFDASPTPIEYFVAEGAARTVAALRSNGQSLIADRETWAGGGNSSVADGSVSRTNFLFTSAVRSVFAIADGNVFVATQTQVFRVSSNGFVFLVAGTGSPGDSGDDSVATAATFTSIASVIAQQDGTVFIADSGAHRIRTIPANQGNVIRAFAGTGATNVVADGVPLSQTTFIGPQDMDFSENDGLFVADGARVRLLEAAVPAVSPEVNITIAGSATQTGNTGDGGPLLAARFQVITGISVYFDLFSPNPTTFDLVVTDGADHTVRVLDRARDNVVLAMGQHGQSGDAPDVSSAEGLLNGPTGVFGTGAIVVADRGNGKIRTRFPFQLDQ